MSSKNARESSRLVTESVVRTSWVQIMALQKQTAIDLGVAEPETFENPFTGEVTATSRPSDAGLQLREIIQQSSLKDDERFVPVLDEVIRSAARDAIWSLLAAFDGSGAFVGDREIGLYDAETQKPVDTYMHEVFDEFDPRNQ